MKVNTHGMKMVGLKAVSGETKDLRGSYDPYYLQINYNKLTGKVWTNEHCDLGHSWHSYYHDDDIVESGCICNPMSMQEIADMIYDKANGICRNW